MLLYEAYHGQVLFSYFSTRSWFVENINLQLLSSFLCFLFLFLLSKSAFGFCVLPLQEHFPPENRMKVQQNKLPGRTFCFPRMMCVCVCAHTQTLHVLVLHFRRCPPPWLPNGPWALIWTAAVLRRMSRANRRSSSSGLGDAASVTAAVKETAAHRSETKKAGHCLHRRRWICSR